MNFGFDSWRGTIEFYAFECNGDEDTLSKCKHESYVARYDCPTHYVAGLRCYQDYDVRLTGSAPNPDMAGRLEIYMNGSWETICDAGWGDEDAVVACRQLGLFRGHLDQQAVATVSYTHLQCLPELWL
ncbi:neurotrypsin-like [Anneissia japonica]|uniref:neurotrypsin-like n=1 Tax=Anneissia japonica TaxID=1529436 RepID=UPI001425B275|nr:neurotrypsin-like [Anneissia japonica]